MFLAYHIFSKFYKYMELARPMPPVHTVGVGWGSVLWLWDQTQGLVRACWDSTLLLSYVCGQSTVALVSFEH
jgi:hypothetical protein